ncbi:type IIL restriction-modification enzyme MmeI [Segatella hominis]|uniref:type IIL restriction-modification enzyme MmeI n=1 Tax=Segatella hominis TaxID=2518605 RepID=UPI0038B638B8
MKCKRVSSKRRKYVPMGFIKAGTIVTDRVQIIPAASLYHNCSRGIRNRINSHNPCHIAIRQRWHINYLFNWMLLKELLPGGMNYF